MKVFKTILFWLWSCTYGCIMTLFGAIVSLGCLITGHKPHIFHGKVYFEIMNDYWGGLEAGPFFFVNKNASLYLKQHESGHGIQNLYLGPLFPFIVGIRSAMRYWLYEFTTHKGRCIYCGILSLIICLINGALLTVSLYFGLWWLYIIAGVVVAYFVWIATWLWVECHKFKTGYPDYDDFFWEGNASRVGAKLYPTDNK